LPSKAAFHWSDESDSLRRHIFLAAITASSADHIGPLDDSATLSTSATKLILTVASPIPQASRVYQERPPPWQTKTKSCKVATGREPAGRRAGGYRGGAEGGEMKKVAIISMAMLLSGCYADQVKQEGQCGLDATKYVETNDADATLMDQDTEKGHLIALCMQAHGYVFTFGSRCPEPSRASPSQYGALVGMSQAAPICYAPLSWSTRQIQNVELWVTPKNSN
jgi:hypothetical protein